MKTHLVLAVPLAEHLHVDMGNMSRSCSVIVFLGNNKKRQPFTSVSNRKTVTLTTSPTIPETDTVMCCLARPQGITLYLLDAPKWHRNDNKCGSSTFYQ